MRKSSRSLAIRPRQLPISFRLEQRVPAVLLVLSLAIAIAIVLNVTQGEYAIPPLEVLNTLLGLPTADPQSAFVIKTLRLPRTLVACATGIGLAVSGTILQGLTRNPLASPGIIGVNSGAALAAVSLIVLFPQVSPFALPLSAFVGAFASAVLIYLMTWQKGSSPVKLILIGIGISAIFSALTTLIVTFGEINSVSQALTWLSGSVYARGWEHFGAILPWLLVFVPLSWLLAAPLNLLSLGDDLARGLGTRVEWQRGVLLLSSAALAGAAVSVAGMVGFVGLIAPHLGRQWVGPNHQGLLPAAALMGGLIVILADWLGRVLFAPIELPCGIITAAIGAPYFIYLLIRNRQG